MRRSALAAVAAVLLAGCAAPEGEPGPRPPAPSTTSP
jgi:PBP1b-binding outer membrane lipoprotein LpoB